MRAQIHFDPGKVWLTDWKGNPIQVLTLNLVSEAEYRLYESPASPKQDLDVWLETFPRAWAETRGMGLAKHRPPVFVELNPGADPERVCQYSMSQEALKGINPHIWKLLAVRVLRP
jgi:hypothetical protein